MSVFLAWLKKYKISIIVILCCLLAIAGVITWAILGKQHNGDPVVEEPTEKIYTVMDLGSKGCIPCDNLQPVLAELRTKYEGKINVLFYDIARTTEGAELANQYNVKYMPTLIFLNENGIEVERYVGYLSEKQFEDKFRQLGWIE